MANILSWSQNIDVVVDSYDTVAHLSASTLFQLKKLLIAAGWTVTGTCDSVTAGLDGPGTDRIPTSGAFDPTKWVRAAPATPHSWYILHHATLNMYMCVDCSATSDAYYCIFTFAKTAFTGGTTSARPTSGDEWSHTSLQLNDNSAALTRVNLLVATHGDFAFFTVKNNGSGKGYFGMLCMAMVDADPGDTYPCVTYAYYDGGIYGPFHFNGLQAGSAWRGKVGSNTQVGTMC